MLSLPIPNHASSEPQKKPKNPALLERKNSLNSLNSVLQPIHHAHPRTCLLLTILSLQILLVFTLRSLPLSLSLPNPLGRQANIHVGNSTPVDPTQDPCGSDRIFVYQLPAAFNSEILANCDDLNPWSSRCDALANDGFGRSATGLAGIVPEGLVPAWYWTDQFVSEIVFHNRLLKHKCRVLEPESATAFYIPFYAGLAVGKHLWSNSSARERDRHCEMMLGWVQDQPYYKRSNGWDHFLTMGRITWDFRRSKDHDWGSRCIYMSGMRNITRLLIERNPWDYFDVGVPYPTGFHPRSDSDVIEWQRFVRERNRASLFSFAGATRGAVRNDFRGLLLRQCNETDTCTVVNCAKSRCSNGTSAILETFLGSEFCLQPRGDSFTRRSIFDCMLAGSIPVFFWRRTAYYQYEWFLPDKWESYSVFIDRNAVKNGTSIKDVLESYSKEEVRKMREKVIDNIPKIVYARPQEGLETIKDAFDVAIEGVLRRFREQEEGGFKW
ncbi:xyloglucan galactosyltransferase XLT2-like [Corylus avellana]|uniref:xyloglucan galactosyltransferase XLT2-like n=1 Tax=Corylus avellana TaxID=13451 RepID=UPI001E21B986|nr:xyloglucan galactosyltransferase XLT2-like [Corylus avellana]